MQFIEQAEQRGTGHAIQCAREAIAGYENILVLSGDVPLIRAETLQQLMTLHLAEGAAMTILTAVPEDPTGYGRIIRHASDQPEVEAIVEQKALTPEQQSIREINSGIYAFKMAPLLKHLDELTNNNAHGELYLTDMAGILHAAGEKVAAIKAPEAIEVLGANTIAEVVALDAGMRAATASRLMAGGVTIFRPETCVIDAEVEIEPDTIIEPFVQLLGKTKIGTRLPHPFLLGDRELHAGRMTFSSGRAACSAKARWRTAPRSAPLRTYGRGAKSARTRTWATSLRRRRRSWAKGRRPIT